jgi:transposase
MLIYLRGEERRSLISRHKVERDGYIRDRIKVVLWRDEGASYTEIARRLFIDVETVRRHMKVYEESRRLGPERGGSKKKLNEDQSEALLSHLEEKTYRHVKEIVAYVKVHHGITYSVSGMHHWLKAHGFRYKQPKAIPGKIDLIKEVARTAY